MSDTGEGPRQTIRRMPDEDEEQIGPFFPSGMSSAEATMAGATDPNAPEGEPEVEE